MSSLGLALPSFIPPLPRPLPPPTGPWNLFNDKDGKGEAGTLANAASPAANPMLIYAGGHNNGASSGIIKSVDGGAHWTRNSNGMWDTRIYGVWIHPSDPQGSKYASLYVYHKEVKYNTHKRFYLNAFFLCIHARGRPSAHAHRTRLHARLCGYACAYLSPSQLCTKFYQYFCHPFFHGASISILFTLCVWCETVKPFKVTSMLQRTLR